MFSKIIGGVLLIMVAVFGYQYLQTQSLVAPQASSLKTNVSTIDTVPLATQVGQLFAVGHWPNVPADVTAKRIADLQIGSVIIMAAPDDESIITNWTNAWQATSSIPLLISIDQEGGSVSRLKGPTHLQTAQPDILNPLVAYSTATDRAAALVDHGINTNYSPVLDESVLTTSFMFNRVFSEPENIVDLGTAMINGYQETGVIAVPKHYPGHPDTDDDSHLTLPILDLTLPQYIDHTKQFTGVIAGGQVKMLMTAHVLVPALDPNFPATVSPIVIRDLRDRIGYTGVVITDDLAMQAISDRWDYSQSAVLALNAGADMIMLAAEPENIDTTVAAVIQAVKDGTITKERIYEAYSRVMAVKNNL